MSTTRLEALLAESKRRAIASDPFAHVTRGAHPKQLEFLALNELEALYGGAAGGGKSEALLMAAAQYVHVPGYSALLLRRTFPDLNLPGAIMDRSKKFYGPVAKWHAMDHRWTFPAGSTVQFGYCDSEADLDRYKGAEFQFIGIDEQTEWPETWVRFLFSRLRRVHGMPVPLRMRGATNPDGIGQEWVRTRFGIPLGETPTAPIRATPNRVFLPARAEDNPSLDLVAYELSLKELGPAKYEQLRWGKWVRDGEGLVYKFDASRNRAPGVRWAPNNGWTTILSHDYGTTNATAWAVLGWLPNDPMLYVITSFKRSGYSPSQAARISKFLERKYDPCCIIGDLGGLGKGYAEEARVRFGLPIEPADKQNKRGYIDLLNGDLQSGALRILDGNDDLEKEWNELPWKKSKIPGELKEEAPGFPNHITDAVLYGWRKSLAYAEERQKPRPQMGTAEWQRQEEASLAREVDEERGRQSWEREDAGSWWQG